MSEPETYDLVPDSADAHVRAPRDSRDSSDSPAPAAAPPAIAYQSIPQRHRDEYDVTEGDRLRNLYVPIAIVLVGSAAVFGRIMYFRAFGAPDAIQAMRSTGFMLAWNVGVMVLGAYAIARSTGISFGPLSTATIKLAAIAVAPHAAIFLVELIFVRQLYGTLLGWVAGGAIVWWLFCYLFDLDFHEALICAGVTTVMRWFSYLIYWIS
jgi:hypothetical protein